ncbi:hypothetical protein GEMRC1_003598 [Eukaryota sp. GEM-RC1]
MSLHNYFTIKKTSSSSSSTPSSIATKPTPTETPWIEKFRPKQLQDVACQEETVNALRSAIKSGNLPHLLFYGPPGTGKTSTILAVANELYGPDLIKTRVLELNASDERGIQTVRERIKNFAQTSIGDGAPGYPSPPYKIIILDEADAMTADAQAALRRVIEKYSKITRFCLICNYISRIIDPITSRCAKFRFRLLDRQTSVQRLSFITEKEKVPVDSETLAFIVSLCGGDLRRAVNLLQSSSSLAKSDALTQELVTSIAGVIPSDLPDIVVATAKQGSVDDVLKCVRAVQKYIAMTDVGLTTLAQASWLLAASKVEEALNDGAEEVLQLSSLCVKLVECFIK